MMFDKIARYARVFAAAAIFGLALVGATPGQASGQDQVDLELGGSGATPWSIGNIKPGDSGIEKVTLHNAGDRAGSVTIWFSDIIEYDPAGDGSALQDYLLFDLDCTQAASNIPWPVHLDRLPRSDTDDNYLKIGSLASGQTVTLIWEWEFHETDLPQNDAQGGSLSFSINYLLQEQSSGEPVDDNWGWIPTLPPTTSEPKPKPQPSSTPSTEQIVTSPQQPNSSQTTAPSNIPQSPGISPLKPAEFVVTELILSPASVNLNEPVSAAVFVSNDGGIEGNYTLDLEINGKIEQSRDITLGGGESQKYIFTIVKDEPGSYMVNLNGLTGGFTVLALETTTSGTKNAILAVSLATPTGGVLVYLFAIKFKSVIHVIARLFRFG